jgi:hypothetical protein
MMWKVETCCPTFLCSYPLTFIYLVVKANVVVVT